MMSTNWKEKLISIENFIFTSPKVRCVAGAEVADAAASDSNTDDMDSMHLAGRTRARTLTRTYSNLSQNAQDFSIAELNEKKTTGKVFVFFSPCFSFNLNFNKFRSLFKRISNFRS